MTDVTPKVRCSCSKAFKDDRTRLQHMRDSPLHAPNGSITSGLPSLYPATALSHSDIAQGGVRCTCGKHCKDEKGLEQHKRTSERHRKMEIFAAGDDDDNLDFLGFADEGDTESFIPLSRTPSYAQRATAASIFNFAIPTQASISSPTTLGTNGGRGKKHSRISGATISYSAWDNSASMNPPAAESRSKNPRARTKPTHKSSPHVRPPKGTPVANGSSSFILGVEPLKCCGRTYKTENAMQQHKRDSLAHPESQHHRARPKATGFGAGSAGFPDDSDDFSDTGYGYNYQPYRDPFSYSDKGSDFGLCDTDCGWCGHCADYLDI